MLRNEASYGTRLGIGLRHIWKKGVGPDIQRSGFDSRHEEYDRHETTSQDTANRPINSVSAHIGASRDTKLVGVLSPYLISPRHHNAVSTKIDRR